MHCEVLLFAHLREAVGRDRVMIDLPNGATVAEALQLLAQQHEAIRMMQNRLAVAVNERYASPSTALTDGCTIALIPPVSGG